MDLEEVWRLARAIKNYSEFKANIDSLMHSTPVTVVSNKNYHLVDSDCAACPNCGDMGWLYDDEGRRAGTCHCHY